VEKGREGGRDADVVHHVGRKSGKGRREGGRKGRRRRKRRGLSRSHKEGRKAALVVVWDLHGPWRGGGGKEGGREKGR
jgi:hypothetical protein